MVLVDTSVWIRFLAGRTPYSSGLDALLERDEVAGHDLIYGEPLIGDSGDRRILLDSYQRMERAPLVPHEDVVYFIQSRKLQGKGIGWSDAHLLASSLVAGFPLWTADERLARVARRLGTGYDPPRRLSSPSPSS